MRLPLIWVHLASILIVVNTWLARTPVQAQQPTTPPIRSSQSKPGGGLGDTCGGTKTLTALIPDGQHKLASLSSSPIFWFYLPALPGKTTSVEFTVNSLDEKTQIYQGRLDSPTAPGVVGLSLPPTIRLNPGQTYYWYLRLNCGFRQGKPLAERVNGYVSILQSTPQLEIQVNQANPEILYDSLTIVAKQRMRQQPNAEKEWRRLLNAVGKKNLASEPILPILTLPSP
jgi:hypothetical protein